jgi:uncharacterized protein (DUF58 family)
MTVRRIHIILALTVLTLVLALGTGFPLYFRLFYLIVLALGGSLLWTSLNLWGVKVTVHRASGKLHVGGFLESRMSIYNSSPLPKVGIEARDLSELPGHSTGAVVNLLPHKELHLVWETPLKKRGIYSVGAPIAFSGDPFGVLRLRHREPGSQQLVVLPYMVDIPPFSLAQGELVGHGGVLGNTPASTESVSTVREYQPGDSSRHVHWPSTARKGSLMLKQFDSGMEDVAWVLLDLQRDVQAGENVANTEEYAITAAASVAKNYLEMGWAVGLMAHGDRRYLLPPQQNAPALDRVLMALTEASAQGGIDLAALLGLWHSQMASLAVSLVVITPSVDPGWSTALESLAQQGVSPTVVLVDPGSFGAMGNPQPLLGRFSRRGIPTYLLRNGEDLAQALQRPWHSSNAHPPATGSAGA